MILELGMITFLLSIIVMTVVNMVISFTVPLLPPASDKIAHLERPENDDEDPAAKLDKEPWSARPPPTRPLERRHEKLVWIPMIPTAVIRRNAINAQYDRLPRKLMRV